MKDGKNINWEKYSMDFALSRSVYDGNLNNIILSIIVISITVKDLGVRFNV